VNAAGAPVAYDLRPLLLPEAQDGAPDEVIEVPVRQCGRCGAVGTHYLTCPALRLPRGYRIADPERAPR
jgi:hypothetical protein